MNLRRAANVSLRDGKTFVTAGQMVIACYPAGDAAMRNVAVAVARQLGFADPNAEGDGGSSERLAER